MYETDSQWDNETTFINRQRDQLKDQYGWLWDMEDEALVHGVLGLHPPCPTTNRIGP